MADKTNIEWADATWNPVTGCTKVSPGCDHCYAETLAERFRGVPGNYYEQGFDVQLRPDKLDQPVRWEKPRRIFVNSMSDLFHDDIDDEFIAQVFAVMALAGHHTFQVLTKRHGRMRALLNSRHFYGLVRTLLHTEHGLSEVDAFGTERFPLLNVWLGVSVENQQWADIRIPALLETPAAIRFLSMEPLLGPVDLLPPLSQHTIGLELDDCLGCAQPFDYHDPGGYNIGAECPVPTSGERPIDWVIVGGESGHGARPMHPDWARSLRDQCQAAGVPFLFKQWGQWAPRGRLVDGEAMPVDDDKTGILNVQGNTRGRAFGSLSNRLGTFSDGSHCEVVERVGKKKAGRELDGRTWDEFPEAVS